MKNPETSRRLLEALHKADMTQRELSERAQVKESSVSHYANGSHVPSTLSAGKMALVLDVNPLWLMGYDVPMERTVATSSRTLTATESKLLDAFDCLNQDGQQKATEYIEDLAGNDKYKKDGSASAEMNIA